jgi:hypothetical protein
MSWKQRSDYASISGRQVPLKRRYTSIRVHVVTSQKPAIFVVNAARIPNIKNKVCAYKGRRTGGFYECPVRKIKSFSPSGNPPWFSLSARKGQYLLRCEKGSVSHHGVVKFRQAATITETMGLADFISLTTSTPVTTKSSELRKLVIRLIPGTSHWF